jgi:ABC-type sugar transport system substrate-binding protein
LNYLRPVRASKFSIAGVLVQTQSKIGNPKSQIASLAIALFVMLLPWPNLADAQQTKKVPRIGFLTQRVGIEAREEAFRKGLRELGYIEGQNIIIEWRFTEGKRERQTSLAADLVRLKVDCILICTAVLRLMWTRF